MPKIKLFGIPARYANATYIAAAKAGKLDAVENDLIAFGAVIAQNSELAMYLANPTVTRAEKVALMETVFEGKDKTTDISRNLFTTMAANARLGEAKRVIHAYEELMKAHRGEVRWKHAPELMPGTTLARVCRRR
jgi:F0F1-type ATP synthase delta subunit